MGGHLFEALDDACDDRLARLAGREFVAEHADVLDVHRAGQVDEPPSLVERFLPGGASLVHRGGRAEIGDHQPQCAEVLPGVRKTRAGELRYAREVHLPGHASELERHVPSLFACSRMVFQLQAGQPSVEKAMG